MNAVDDTVWFDVPTFFTPVDLNDDPVNRARRMVTATPTLDDAERLRLVVQQELLILRMRREHVRYAATAVVGMAGEGPPRLSFAQFTIIVKEIDASELALDAVGQQLRATGRTGVGFVDLPVGRALAVADRQRVTSAASVSGRPRDRLHVVQQIQLMAVSPQRRHLAVLALGTECLRDTDFYLDVMGAIGRSVTFQPPSAPTGAPAGSISKALDG